MKKRILFVCLGNICRSPAAEGIMQHLVESRGMQNDYLLDSAGTYGGHAGELPDNRMRIHARRRGYELTHRSRPISTSDFENFDLIVAMDDYNFRTIKNMAPTIEDECKVVKMVDFVENYPQYDCVPDPYYEGAQGFEIVLDLLEDGCNNLLDKLEADRNK